MKLLNHLQSANWVEDDMFDEMQRDIDERILWEMNQPQDEAAGSDENE